MKSISRWVAWTAALLTVTAGAGAQAAPAKRAAAAATEMRCRMAVMEAELAAGKPFERAFGGGLKVYVQPIAAGWIVRVLPVAGPAGDHDYAELATPPYQSPSPLSLSTDFAFRAQDAVAWNPRRFHFASSQENFAILTAAYKRLVSAGPVPPAAVQAELAHQVAQASDGTVTILDARLTPGTADQSRMAAPMAQHFEQTAHSFVPAPAGGETPLGRLLGLRVRVELELPLGFSTAGADPAVRLLPHRCAQPAL